MNKTIGIVLGLGVILLLLLFMSTYTVKFNEVAIRATFGQTSADSVVREPGLHGRLPIPIDKVTKLDTRLQLVESGTEEISTADGLQIVVKAYMLWRVDTESDEGPLNFFVEYRTVESANETLGEQFRTAFTGVLSGYEFGDLLGADSRLAEVETEITDALRASLAARGVRPEAVGISQMLLPAGTSRAVVKRMQAERSRLAEAETKKGTALARSIRSDANTKADKIMAFARQRAEEINSRGQEQAAEYLEQMSEDPDLAVFLVWLDALEASLADYTTVILPTYSPPFHLLDPTAATFHRSVPMPRDGEFTERGGEDVDEMTDGEPIAERGP